jgi:spermidine/putrescine transport system substrate-binding protein
MATLRYAFTALAAILLGGGLSQAAAGELRVLAWEGYLAPAVVARFEAETGHRVVVDAFLSVSEQKRRLAERPGVYDIAMPPDYEVAGMAERGELEAIEAERLPGYANILDGWRSPPYDRRNEHSVPFHWGTTSLVVDTALYHGDDLSIRLLFDPPPELKDRTGFLIGAEETLRMALMWLGLPQCTSDREQLRRAVDLVRPMIHKDRVYSIADAVEVLASGRVGVGIAWNGDALRARERRPSLRYVYPKEGLIIWSDTLVVPKGAPNRDAALQFIDFALRPEIAALQSNHTRYANTIRGSDAFLDPALLDAPEVVIPSDVTIRFFRSCDSEQLTLYAEIWDPLLRELGR